MSAVFVYVTASSEKEARGIARAVVEDRLAACANIIPGMKSAYHWEGKIEEADETVVIFKTRAELFAPLSARVKALHSHDTPCIAALPVSAGDKDYLAWIAAETQS